MTQDEGAQNDDNKYSAVVTVVSGVTFKSNIIEVLSEVESVTEAVGKGGKENTPEIGEQEVKSKKSPFLRRNERVWPPT